MGWRLGGRGKWRFRCCHGLAARAEERGGSGAAMGWQLGPRKVEVQVLPWAGG